MARNDAQHLGSRRVDRSHGSLIAAARPLAEVAVKDGPIRQAHGRHHAQRIGSRLILHKLVISIHPHLFGRHHAPIGVLLRLAAKRPGARVYSCIVGVFVRDHQLLDGLPRRVHLGNDPARVMTHQHSAGRAALHL